MRPPSESSSADRSAEHGRRPESRQHRVGRAVTLLAVLAGLMLLACVYFAVGPRGDISYRYECRGTTVRSFLHPQATHPELDVDFVDPARLCNEDAVGKMHRAFALLPAGVVLGLGALGLHRRRVREG